MKQPIHYRLPYRAHSVLLTASVACMGLEDLLLNRMDESGDINANHMAALVALVRYALDDSLNACHPHYQAPKHQRRGMPL